MLISLRKTCWGKSRAGLVSGYKAIRKTLNKDSDPRNLQNHNSEDYDKESIEVNPSSVGGVHLLSFSAISPAKQLKQFTNFKPDYPEY